MLLINKSVIFVTCSNCVWFILVFIIFFNVYPHIFNCRVLNRLYPYNLWDINMYMHIRPCLADNFVHMFLSAFFHERHNLDLSHFKSQDLYDNYFSSKKKMVLYRSVDNCVYYFSYVSEKMKQSLFNYSSKQLFFRQNLHLCTTINKKLLIKWCSSNNVNCCSFSFVQKPLMIRNNK